MAWVQTELSCQLQQLEPLEQQLWALGALSVTYRDAADQPLFEPKPGEIPLWQEIRLVGLFDGETDCALLQMALNNIEAASQISVFVLEDQPWERAWMDEFQPAQYGERLWVVPRHMTPPEPTAVNLLLDPGLAFGTGSHPTTAMAMRWLDQHVVSDSSLLDYGCGSGILAIAGLLLGAGKAWGVDIDPQAISASLDNAKENGVDADLNVFLPEHFLLDQQVDLVVANILCEPLIELAETLTQFVRPGGRMALTGVLAEQVPLIIEAYAPYCEMQVGQQQDEWVLLEASFPT